MKPDTGTALLALVEASKALQLAHRALMRLGAHAQAADVSDMGADVMALIADIGRRPVIDVQVAQ